MYKRHVIVNMVILPKLIPTWLSHRSDQADARIQVKMQRTQNSQSNLEKKKKKREKAHSSHFKNLLQSYSN